MIDYCLKNKIVVVTGGTKGIGRAIVKMFAEYGAIVAFVGRNEERAEQVLLEIKELGSDGCYFLGDLADDSFCKEVCQSVADRYGKIDVLVNCAGLLTKSKIDEVTRDEWDMMLGANLSSCFFMSQQAIPFMKKAGAGRIINISSNAGRMGGYENSQSYTATKGAIISITMGMARQLAKDGITVNVVCPGTTESEMSKLYDEETRKRLIDRIPIGRFAKPEEVAATVCFLASHNAACITGAIIDVNGGMYMG